jgi:formylglycine-generating enzyme required for sulfatase activity
MKRSLVASVTPWNLRRNVTSCFAILLLSAFSHHVHAGLINIETVPVGNTSNLPIFRGTKGPPLVDKDGAPILQTGAVDYEYNMGKYEVTAGQYTAFLNAVAATDTYGLYNFNMDVAENPYGCNIVRTGTSGNFVYSVANDWANRPVNFVSWGDAARFANWLQNGQPSGVQSLATTEDGAYFLNGATSSDALIQVTRNVNWEWAIPTEAEWFKSAYHKNDGNTGNYFYYSTSSETDPGYVDRDGFLRTEFGGPTTQFIEGGTDPGNYATQNGMIRGQDGIGSPYYRTEVGEWENSTSPYGTYDQSGNVWEWTELVATDMIIIPGDDVSDYLQRVIRGGSAFTLKEMGREECAASVGSGILGC